jgi:hypothetical protein
MQHRGLDRCKVVPTLSAQPAAASNRRLTRLTIPLGFGRLPQTVQQEHRWWPRSVKPGSDSNSRVTSGLGALTYRKASARRKRAIRVLSGSQVAHVIYLTRQTCRIITVRNSTQFFPGTTEKRPCPEYPVLMETMPRCCSGSRNPLLKTKIPCCLRRPTAGWTPSIPVPSSRRAARPRRQRPFC